MTNLTFKQKTSKLISLMSSLNPQKVKCFNDEIKKIILEERIARKKHDLQQ